MKNLELLNDEPAQNFRISAEELQGTASDRENVQVRYWSLRRLSVKRIMKSYFIKEKKLQDGTTLVPERDDKARNGMTWTEKYFLIHTTQEGLTAASASRNTPKQDGRPHQTTGWGLHSAELTLVCGDSPVIWIEVPWKLMICWTAQKRRPVA